MKRENVQFVGFEINKEKYKALKRHYIDQGITFSVRMRWFVDSELAMAKALQTKKNRDTDSDTK